MTRRSHFAIAIAGAMIILITGGALTVWPNGTRAQGMREDIVQLRGVSVASASVTERLEGLSRELQRLRQRRRQIVRPVPPQADVDRVVNTMLQSLDGQAVFGPTVRRGAVVPAVPGSTLSEQALPLHVDMDASLDSIFNLLHSVESMDRLVRVASVRAEVDRMGDTTGPPLLTTTIGLELVFDPPPAEEGF